MIPPSAASDPGGTRELLEVMTDAAREAAAFVLTGFRRRGGIGVEHKGPVDLVTRFDKEAEALLRARLRDKTAIAIRGEEAGGDVPGDGPAFHVDPIDGTTNYVHGHPFYCVSVGLAVGGRARAGVVVAPSLRNEWRGVAGADAAYATRDGEPCRVSDVDRVEDALLATGFPYDRRTNPDNNFDAFVAIKKRCQAVRRCGSAALDLCLVADGTYDGYWEKRLQSWDVAAGIAIVAGAGGRVSGFDGGGAGVLPGPNSVVATNGHVHDALLRLLGLALRVHGS